MWPAEVAGPQHAAAYQRWLAVYRWLQAATPAVAAAADAEPRTRSVRVVCRLPGFGLKWLASGV